MCGTVSSVRRHPSRVLSLPQLALFGGEVASYDEAVRNADLLTPLPAHKVVFSFAEGGAYQGVHVEVQR